MRDGHFRRAYIGVGAGERPLPPRFARKLGRNKCIEVAEVVEDAPAARAGIKPGDLLLAFNGEPLNGMNDLQRHMVGERIGTALTFTVARDEFVFEVSVVPAELTG
jgi:S1-C subfamily serine protease